LRSGLPVPAARQLREQPGPVARDPRPVHLPADARADPVRHRRRPAVPDGGGRGGGALPRLPGGGEGVQHPARLAAGPLPHAAPPRRGGRVAARRRAGPVPPPLTSESAESAESAGPAGYSRDRLIGPYTSRVPSSMVTWAT